MFKDGKLFGKISIIDIFVVIVIAVLFLGIYSRFAVNDVKVETQSQPLEYTMKVSNVRIGTVNALKDYMGPIYDDTTKEYLGEITGVTYEKAKVDVKLANGQLKEDESPDRYNVMLTVKVDGNVNDRGYYTANNLNIGAGSNFIFSSKAAITTGIVQDIYEADLTNFEE